MRFAVFCNLVILFLVAGNFASAEESLAISTDDENSISFPVETSGIIGAVQFWFQMYQSHSPGESFRIWQAECGKRKGKVPGKQLSGSCSVARHGAAHPRMAFTLNSIADGSRENGRLTGEEATLVNALIARVKKENEGLAIQVGEIEVSIAGGGSKSAFPGSLYSTGEPDFPILTMDVHFSFNGDDTYHSEYVMRAAPLNTKGTVKLKGLPFNLIYVHEDELGIRDKYWTFLESDGGVLPGKPAEKERQD